MVIIFLTQLFAWICVVLPMQQYATRPLLLDSAHFLFLSLSTVCIAAAGYIINDYFDLKIDVINKPDKVVLQKGIPVKMAIIAHTMLNVAALWLAALVALPGHHPEWMIVQLVCTALLWLYSTRFKRQFMSGNVVVALLTALTIVVVMVYEPAMHQYAWKSYFINTGSGLAPNPVWVLGVYTFFAFMLTWMREIVKDMEDYKGDELEGCVTMPIRWGLQRSVRFVQMLGVLAVLPLVMAAVKLCMVGWWPLGIYAFAGLSVPLAWWLLYLQQKATTAHYHSSSKYIKIIMVLGIGSLVIYYFQAHA